MLCSSPRQNTDQLIGDPSMIGGAEFGHPPTKVFKKGKLTVHKPPQATIKTPNGDVVRVLLDSDSGSLTVKKNGTVLGTPWDTCLTGDLCWAVCLSSHPGSVRIKALDPNCF